ncbi:MAG TPA: hypothetical protein PK079_23460 [Leptospiraceae bacterium]|nr:hypothetical protein [Leptospiraceae bacterium]HMW07613.1 hypothetical protein [Leptospiraceae bacterium]HMX33009.1 hypothetical protein [Leptospiraceae bacterium]HMY33268.1 hypothetical protein [Leptospiraceae bacterium]HMZ67289.1 hypothetical protein [Leptospiraceae bacterium]
MPNSDFEDLKKSVAELKKEIDHLFNSIQGSNKLDEFKSIQTFEKKISKLSQLTSLKEIKAILKKIIQSQKETQKKLSQKDIQKFIQLQTDYEKFTTRVLGSDKLSIKELQTLIHLNNSSLDISKKINQLVDERRLNIQSWSDEKITSEFNNTSKYPSLESIKNVLSDGLIDKKANTREKLIKSILKKLKTFRASEIK